ncbi:hypothetical protein [Streptomyces griseus]|uniref:hypothetical protein n=1 Tax=Streptomyces griseus TaxID=1911 RepID=UPI0033B3E3E8
MKTSLLAAIDTAESEADTLELPPVPEFGSVGIKVVSPKTREDAQAVGQFFNAVAEQSISHIDQPLLATALAGAQKRPLGARS